MNFSGRLLDGRYKLETLISTSGMSEIYFGRHTLLGRKIAVKILNAEWAHHEDVVTRFVREARAATAVGHPNIIEVLDVGFIDETQPYIVMEYLRGECLATMLKREGVLSLSALCGLLEPLLQALSVVHQHGIVHRDLKPENIYINIDSLTAGAAVKLLDFGIAKFTAVAPDQRVTISGASIGTPAYMSPEQAKGDLSLDRRSDLYTIGVVMYEILTGKMPFVGETIQETLTQIVENDANTPSALNPDFPVEALPIIERAMAKDREERYGTADELLNALRSLDAFQHRTAAFEETISRIAMTKDPQETPSTDTGATLGEGEEDLTARVAMDPVYENAKITTIAVWDNQTQTSKGKFAVLMAGIIGLSVTIGSVLTIWLANASKTASTMPLSPVCEGREAEGDGTRTIKVTGVPMGAGVYYNNEKISSNPYQVVWRAEHTSIILTPPEPPEKSAATAAEKKQALKVVLVAEHSHK